MNFTYENQGTHTYLVYTVTGDDAIDTMSLGMITNNKIHGLAHTLYTQMDSTKFIKYDVSAKIPVKQFFSGVVNKKRLLGVFNGIVDALLCSEDYMIDVNSILLDMDYIFADVSTCETVLICLPIVSDDLSARDLGAFFRNIMISTQFDQTENCDYMARILNFLNSRPVFSLADFKQLLTTIDSGATQAQQRVVQNVTAQQPQPAPQPQPAQSAQPRVQPPQTPVSPVNNTNFAPAQGVQAQPPQRQPQPQMNVPQMNVPQSNMGAPNQQPAQPGDSEDKMSFLYLMQHYNAENAAKYKAQKEAKKTGNLAGVPNPHAAPAAPNKANIPNAQPDGWGFAVPGQQPAAPAAPNKVNVPNQQNDGWGMAVPGKPAAAPAAPNKANVPNAQSDGWGFSVPGQPAAAPVASNKVNTPTPQANNGGFAIPGQQTPVAPQQPAINKPNNSFGAVPNGMPQNNYAQQQVPQGRPMNFGETTVLGGGGGNIGETTVLGAASMAQVMPHLIRSKNNERIDLNKPVFRIGKEKSFVDYFIGDNSAISRSHANIISRDGEYFIVDTNSTNHTYVNGQMIQSNQEIKLIDGSQIKLANEGFEFKLK